FMPMESMRLPKLFARTAMAIKIAVLTTSRSAGACTLVTLHRNPRRRFRLLVAGNEAGIFRICIAAGFNGLQKSEPLVLRTIVADRIPAAASPAWRNE